MNRFRADLDKFRADMSENDSAFERLRADMAKRDSEMAQRESNRMLWLVGLWNGGVLVTIAVLGIFIRLSI